LLEVEIDTLLAVAVPAVVVGLERVHFRSSLVHVCVGRQNDRRCTTVETIVSLFPQRELG
jgi:hypothetical protein